MNSTTHKKFRDMTLEERLEHIKNKTKLEDKEIALFNNTATFGFDEVNKMIENAIGIFQIPLGIANNFVINDKEYLIPMATEEPSVIAAASNAAKIVKETGGFKAKADKSIMIGQIQLVSFNSNDAHSIDKSTKTIIKNKLELINIANT